MKIVCHSCGQKYHIDDNKFLKQESLYLKCPKCKEIIKIDQNRLQEESKKALLTISSNKQKIEDIIEDHEIFSPDTKTSLIYSNDDLLKKDMLEQLTALNYETRYLTNYEDLVTKLKYNIYNLIFLHQKEFDLTEDIKLFLDYINSLPSEIRRQLIVIVIMPNVNRHNLLTAFSLGADLAISFADVADLGKIVPDIIRSKQTNYKVFLECKDKMTRGIRLGD
ncbi:MAG: zinc-ribbon domain-containing protein [Dissulfurimicrobium sp.]|uniref:zinc-ribbon domain-containing protein n=1 Tax=Dissulfurimicrobium sp. TaxID=2022436 RepID=UPI004049B48E